MGFALSSAFLDFPKVFCGPVAVSRYTARPSWSVFIIALFKEPVKGFLKLFSCASRARMGPNRRREFSCPPDTTYYKG